MSETVFIIGAGASKPAGAPLMDNFLDVAEKLRKAQPQDKDFDLVFRGIDALQAVHSKAMMDLNNIESVFAAFEMSVLLGELNPLAPEEIPTLPAAMSHVIQRTLETEIKFPVSGQSPSGRSILAPPPYGQIADMIAGNSRGNPIERVSFISFNYDVCLDYALYRSSLGPDYCIDPAAAGRGIKLLKLHGSLNWTRCPECKKVVPWHLSDFFRTRQWPLFGDTTEIRFDISGNLTQFRHCGSHARVPYLVPPTWNKTRYHEELEKVWKAAAHELSTAENILVCGYSLPESDLFFRYLFALGAVGQARIKRFWVINPDKNVKARFERLCGQSIASRFWFFEERVEDNLAIFDEVFK